MKRFLAVLLIGVCSLARAEADTIYVSETGNDGWTGKVPEHPVGGNDGPFATLQRAQRAVRELKSAQPNRKQAIVVEVRGTLYVREPLVLTPDDSGSADAPVIWRGAGEACIDGGQRLTGFQRDEKGRWQVQVASAKGDWSFNQLFVNGQRRLRPRLPKNSYNFIAASLTPSDPKLSGYDRFKFKKGQFHADWKNLNDVEVLTFHNWYMSRFRIASVDEARHVVQFTGTTFAKAGWSALSPGLRYIIENVAEALSDPGEWYFDRETGILTYIPLPGEDMAHAAVIAPRAEKLVKFQGDLKQKKWVEHVRFENLTFAHTNWTLPPKGYSFCQAEAALGAAISAVGARNCAFERCRVTQVGDYAFEFGAGCKNNRVEKCALTDLGAGGVKIGEMQIRADDDDVASGNVVADNFIGGGGRVHPAAIGVWVGQSPNNSIVHNEIFDFYYSGVSLGWTWGYGKSGAHHNDVSYNHIHTIGQGVLTDMGCIYTLGISTGTTLKYNLMHDVESHSYGGWGIYFDEGSQDILAENNISYRLRSSGFHQHYGRENRVINNIFAFGHEAQLMRSRSEDHLSFTFERNIVYWTDAPLLASNWDGGLDRFILRKNLYWRTDASDFKFARKTFAEWQKSGQDVDSIIADPLFVDPENGNFALKPGSPAAKIGFAAIDMSTNGPRAALPNAARAFVRTYPPKPAPPPPEPIADDFEDTPVGEKPVGMLLYEENNDAVIRVTDETAVSGKHCLKFVDGPGQKVSYNPHGFYEPRYKDGVIEGSFNLRMEPGAILSHEWRTQGHPYHTGPSITVNGDGTLLSRGKPLVKLPHGQWVRIAITAGLGKDANAKWTLAVTLPGAKEPERFDLSCEPEFNALYWVGFVSNAQTKTIFYVDDVRVGPK